MHNPTSLDTVCAALTYAMGIDKPKQAAIKNQIISDYVDKIFAGGKADRVIMYNPDAIAQWIYEKYPQIFTAVKKNSDIEVPLSTVMPSVTPVCFGTMYTGAQPAVHGIQQYDKPIIRIDTIFDALIRAGKKPALITYGRSSLSRIYLERNMDYYQYEPGGIADVNARLMQVIVEDKHDFIAVYNGNYDAVMHKTGPESIEALAEARLNGHMYSVICKLVQERWGHHNTLVGFAMDHGCHEIDDNNGSHGLDMDEDINIVHLYKGFPAKEV